MNVQLLGNEQLTGLLNEWYLQIRARNKEDSIRLKKEIESQIHNLKVNQNLLFYYSLLNFRHKYLINNLAVSKNSFDDIESFDTPKEDILSYYYHFFKAIHSNAIGNYSLAEEHYDKAESLLVLIPDGDDLEKAEFYYNLATFCYHSYQAVLALKHISRAKDIFSNNEECELKVAYCYNLLGLICTHLKDYALAEEYFISAMDIFQKTEERRAIFTVRHNLGLLYASQNQSSLAIKYLSEVSTNNPTHYKAIFIEAREHYKLKNTDIVSKLTNIGLSICKDLQNNEYLHHFYILQAFNNNIPPTELENLILAGITYFEKEKLFEYTQEYTEKLAHKFYQEDNHLKASKYFYLASKSKEKILKKEALK
ncbi:Rap family tetratricopeptide repeat protein [Bacillus pseudomycoides]|uniref:Tetratricopeptide repeat protein n=1 Tax=Bacillus pseudomycoides TaxID=64104 RepID=A0AAJ2DNZ3_9BACI|nr:Rap family tetratricopeptide repeat protein [Bacillus pseudomycoides]MDR4329261.1 tetratricopeptide repeat protein [Bacillus pseudomycoides]